MPKTKLVASLGLWTCVSLVAGGVIGSGIFMKPAVMANHLGSPELLLVVWVGAGIITLFGALSNSEVAAMMPETGGQFIFLKRCMATSLPSFTAGQHSLSSIPQGTHP